MTNKEIIILKEGDIIKRMATQNLFRVTHTYKDANIVHTERIVDGNVVFIALETLEDDYIMSTEKEKMQAKIKM